MNRAERAMLKLRLRIELSVIAALVLAAGGQTAAAAPSYAAAQIIASAPVASLDQLEGYVYTVGFKNTGRETWQNDGAKAVTVKTTERVVREHWFASPRWLDKTTAASLRGEAVEPGEVGFFTLTLQAPATARAFTNRFALFVGGTKVSGTDFTMPITVTKQTAPVARRSVATAAVASPASLKTTPYLTAARLIQSSEELSLTLGESRPFQIGFKNSGERNWRDDAPSRVTLELDPASAPNVTLTDGRWPSATTPAVLGLKLVKPGEVGFFSFTVKPSAAGVFQPQFRLVMNGDTLVKGSEFRLPITVAAPPPPPPAPTLAAGPTPDVVCAAAADPAAGLPPGSTEGQAELPSEPGLCNPPHSEPVLRVGLASAQGQVGVTASQPFSVTDSAGSTLLAADPAATVFLAYDPIARVYTAVGPGPIVTSALPLRVRAAGSPSVVTLTTFANPAAFNATLNDNVYRGTIEIQWSDNDQKLWMINELGLEEYLRGLAESSNAAPTEYQKALVVAARSYALYHHETRAKHLVRHFDVIATVGDQYYRGYSSELRLPNVTAAAEATRGQIVTYQGRVAITPYSAATNGTSRTWEEVWGGSPKPWLVRQAVPEDVGRTRFGHGVGLSQLAAADQARAGKNYVDILKFFYVGTEVAQWY